jgi:hypothetical protein
MGCLERSTASVQVSRGAELGRASRDGWSSACIWHGPATSSQLGGHPESAVVIQPAVVATGGTAGA